MKSIIVAGIFLPLIFVIAGCDTSYTDSGTTADESQGKGGSLARFAVANNNLYVVTPNSMKLFNISNPLTPEYTDSIYLGFGIETIFPYGDNLFIGTQTGMHIYDISIPSVPAKLSDYQHIYSCDPVVADDNYAYVTLNSNNTRCGRSVNRLDIIDISNLMYPQRVAEYAMQGPEGLGVKDDVLFVCDNGLKVYDITNRLDIKLLKYFDISATDVIPYNDKLLVTGEGGLYQYSFNGAELTLLSKISVEPE